MKNGNTLGSKYETIAHIGADMYPQLPGLTFPYEIWPQIDDGIVKLVECLAQGSKHSLVEVGRLQYTWLVKDGREHGKRLPLPWGARDYFMIPRAYVKIIIPKEVTSDDQ